MNCSLSSLILLLLIPDYSGRVEQTVTKDHSTLTISDVRERDSGEYQLMFIMKDGVKHLSSAAVSLTVTVLQVRMNPASTNQTDETVELICDSSCDFTSGVYYSWMKNRQHFKYTQSPNMSVSVSRDAGSFSCSLYPHYEHPSSSVCISKSGCWDVTYTSRRVCALVGSTVDISGTYSLPSGYTVNKTFWHYVWPEDFKDLREEHQFAGRVEYVGNKLRIKELKIRDSGEYRFRFITDTTKCEYSGSPGVILTVTDTQVTSNPDIISERQEVTLICSLNATRELQNTYIWIQERRQDLREEHQFAGRVEYVGNKLRIKELKISDSGEYLFRFITNITNGKYSGSPGVILTVTDTQVTSNPDIISEGQEVILICSTKCTLNYKHTYIWYKNGRQVTDGFTKDNKLYLDSVSDEELHQYSCAVGDHKQSTALRNSAIILCVFLAFALIGVLWYRRRRCTLSKIHMIEKREEEVQYDSVHNNTAPSDLTQKADAADNQDIHYSSIHFKTKHPSSITTDEYPTDTTETETVLYANVMFK
ncbi:hypothetical protein cypCar_00034836 [Cyprinus carpio]|nr:hypothetical protein cypCar_00034836 [Cyprinus carpio]